MQANLQKVTNGHNNLATAFNKNTEAFGASLQYIDAMLWILRTVTNDMLNGCLVTIVDGDVKQVDIPAYLRRYEEFLAKREKNPVTLVKGELEEQPVVFGGQS